MPYVCSFIQRQACVDHELVDNMERFLASFLLANYWLARQESNPRIANFKASTVKTTPEYFQKVLVAPALLGMLLGTGRCLMGASCLVGLKSLALACQCRCSVMACFLLARRICDSRSWMCSSVCWEAWTRSLGRFGLLLGIAVTVTWEGGIIVRISKL
jgi:hypothetical protein